MKTGGPHCLRSNARNFGQASTGRREMPRIRPEAARTGRGGKPGPRRGAGVVLNGPIRLRAKPPCNPRAPGPPRFAPCPPPGSGRASGIPRPRPQEKRFPVSEPLNAPNGNPVSKTGSIFRAAAPAAPWTPANRPGRPRTEPGQSWTQTPSPHSGSGFADTRQGLSRHSEIQVPTS